MPPESGEDKTEPATPKKREDARKKGQVAKSMEIASATVLIGSLMAFQFMGFRMAEQMGEFMSRILASAGTFQVDMVSIRTLWVAALTHMGTLVLPIMAVAVVASAASNIMQVGLMYTTEPVMPKLERVDPMKGLKRIFSKQSIMTLVKSIMKIVIIGAIAFITIKGEYNVLFHLYDMEIITIASYMGEVSLKILMRAALGILGIAAMDYAFQRWQYEQNLKMTKQEVKDEMKQREGDPLVKSRIRSVQMKMARQRMMAAVPEADVVITNPTHLAVVLYYEHGSLEAPKMVAKGAGHVAAKIIEIARKNRVPVVEDKLLARSLFSMVEVGRLIPLELYRAVAEILAYVYKIKQRA